MAKAMVEQRRVVVLLVALAVLFATLVALATQPAQAAYPGGNGYLVFTNNFDLYAMPSDGSTPPAKIADGSSSRITDPAFSPDGTQIAFSRDVSGTAAIWVADFDSSGPGLSPVSGWQQITLGPTDGSPTWSPDGTKVAFTRRNETSVASGSATTEDLTGLVLTDSAALFQTSSLVAPGMLVRNTITGASGRILTIDSDTSLTLAAQLAGGTNQVWSVGDTYTITPFRRQIFWSPTDGSDLTGTVLSSSGALPSYDDSNPVWSPLGDKIAFETTENGNADIYTMMAADGTSRTNLTGASAYDSPIRRPAWSPDGTRIAFDAKEPNGVGGANIWTVDAADGANGTNVTGTPSGSDDDTQAAFSPDGSKIAFARSGTGGDVVWTIGVDGSNLAVVEASITPQGSPDWQPAIIGVDDGYTVNEGATLVVPASGVLTNDDVVTALPSATVSLVSDVSNGALTLNADGSFTYIHDGTETTTDTFTYRPAQGTVSGSVATVTIGVTPQNDPPVAGDDGPYAVAWSGTFAKPAPGVLANDTDPEGMPLTAVLKTDVSNGALTLNADGSFTYTHDGSKTTADSFTYQAQDGDGAMSNIATVSLTIGAKPTAGHTTGLVDPESGKWYLYDDAGALTTSFFFGNPGDYPFMGDWDGDGVETPGLYRQSDGFVYLSNSNAQSVADIRFYFGNPGDVPIAGDFNGDGFDTVSIYRPSNQTFYIINELGSNDGGLGAAEFSYVFGNPGDKPFVGDFNGDGVETVGLHRESTGLVYFRNIHAAGNADAQFIFGDPGDRIVAGDWNDNGTFTPALFRPSNTTMYFRYTNSQGNADNQFTVGQSGWLPVAGHLG